MEIPEELRDQLRFHPVRHMDEVIALALGDALGGGDKAPKTPRKRRTVAKKAASGEEGADAGD